MEYSFFTAIECELPVMSNRDVDPAKSTYYNGDVVKFSCVRNYVRVGPASAQCYYFGWFPSPPTCKGNSSVDFIVVGYVCEYFGPEDFCGHVL